MSFPTTVARPHVSGPRRPHGDSRSQHKQLYPGGALHDTTRSIPSVRGARAAAADGPTVADMDAAVCIIPAGPPRKPTARSPGPRRLLTGSAGLGRGAGRKRV